jgi:hypothetical protein
MSKAEKLFEKMERNPRDNFSIEDIASVCRLFGLECEAPKRGSHFTISHESQEAILTVPHKRPIKPVYIRQFVSYVSSVRMQSGD